MSVTREITFNVPSSQVRRVVVTFPLYRAQHLCSATVYMRVESVGESFRETTIRVSEFGGTIELAVDDSYVFGDSGSGYLLGQGVYASNEAEFTLALSLLKEKIGSVSP